ncbi:MAG: hypothetical protein ACREF4_21205 [Gammaproteobacteria bacterium]
MELLDESCRTDRMELADDRAMRLMTWFSELAGDRNVAGQKDINIGTWTAQLRIVREELEICKRNGEKVSLKTLGAVTRIRIELDQLAGRFKSEALENP